MAGIRACVRKALADWGVDDPDGDNALVVTELIGNALRHGAPEVALTLVAVTGQVLGMVTDRGRLLPRIRPACDLATHGRGLHLVGDVVSAWGAGPHPDGGPGKAVWWAWWERSSA